MINDAGKQPVNYLHPRLFVSESFATMKAWAEEIGKCDGVEICCRERRTTPRSG